jgi:5-methyltetrahydropteroyltriglutamate--homocysteine methyltransferase
MLTATVGFPRIGPQREMKRALEDYWAGRSGPDALLAAARAVEEGAWRAQAAAGIDLIALDGTLYDHVLDFCVTYLGLAPPRFQHLPAGGLDLYFAAARGAENVQAMAMSKLYDTNYHCLVPELADGSQPRPDWSPLLDRVRRGQAAVGVGRAVPILLGPVTLVALARGEFDHSAMVARLVPAYTEALEALGELGVPEVQVVAALRLYLHLPYPLAAPVRVQLGRCGCGCGCGCGLGVGGDGAAHSAAAAAAAWETSCALCAVASAADLVATPLADFGRAPCT